MKSNIFVPVLALTAGAAFGLGWVIKPNDPNEAGSGAKSQDGKRIGSGSGSRPTSRPSSIGSGKSGSGPVDEFVARFANDGVINDEDMKAAIEAMRKENDPLLRRKLFTALLEQLTPDNAKAAYLAMQGGRGGGFGRGGGGDDEVRLLANAWGRIDGPGAIKALTEMREAREAEGGEGRGGRGRGGDMRGGMDLVSVLSGWATVDGAAAGKHVNSIEDERQQRMAAYGVVRGMMVNGVEGAMDYVASLPKSEDGARAQSFYMSTIAAEMLEQGLDSAKAWVSTINDPDLMSGALSRVAESAVREDLAGAVEWVTQFAGDESAERAISRVANEWAEDDPQAVLAWADNLPEGAKAQAYGEAFEEWTRSDATAAGEFLTNMPASTARDSAVEEFASNLARQEPETAIRWAETIGNQESRTETLTQVARSWYFRDQAAATAWLATSGLPAESVEAVTAERERGGFDRGRGGGGDRGGRGGGR